MNGMGRSLSLVFAAGCFGGIVNSLLVWWCGDQGITQLLNVKLAPALNPAWLYPRIVWGGLWGFLFLIPIFARSAVKKGLILSLGPTLAQLFWVFPHMAHKGTMGMALGQLTPLLVLVFNAVWGLAAAAWLRWAAGKA